MGHSAGNCPYLQSRSTNSPPSDAGDDGARILTNGLKSGSVCIDHEVEARSNTTSSLGELARAITIHAGQARLSGRADYCGVIPFRVMCENLSVGGLKR
jgi:hypothetical protein